LNLQGIFLLVFLFFETIGYFYITSVRDKEVNDILNHNVEQNKILYHTLIESFETRSDMIFDSLNEKSVEIYTFLKNGWSEDEGRRELKKTFNKTFGYLKEKYGVEQLHFHTEDSRSLYRFHKPEQFGDSLISFRESLKIMQRDKKVVRGFEEGLSFNSIRNIYPIIFEGEFLGSVEINFSFKFIQELAFHILPYKYSFIIYDKNKVLESRRCFDKFQRNFISQYFYNDFGAKISCKNLEKMIEANKPFQDINRMIQSKVEDKLLKFEEFAVFKSYEDKFYSVSFIPMKSISGKSSAYFVAYEKNNKAIQHEFELMRSRILILTLSLSIIFSLLYLFISKELEMRNLNRELRIKIREEIEASRKKDRVILQQSKLSAMAEMINSIAHHWRQPLNRISLEVLNIEEDFFYGDLSEETLQQHSEGINQSLQYLSRVIDDFREFYKPPKEQEQTDISLVIKKSVENMQKDGIRIDIRNYLTDKYEISFCEEFNQVIQNIVGNAIYAIKKLKIESGLIIISLLERNKNGILVSIKDNGGGIDKGISDRIFEPYFTTKNEDEEATGMGLYVSKIIVETNMDGELSFISHEKGSEFQINLN
jgi:signal transduction histidine kinase